MLSHGGVGKKLKILVIGFGLEVAHCLRMAEDGHEIFYYTPVFSAYPSFEDFAAGLGYDSLGVKKVMYPFQYVDEVDLIVCFDVGFGDLLDNLRKQGKVVFGSSFKGDQLENDRELMRKLQGKMGLPVQKTDVIKGIPALREFLKKNPDKFVKLNIFRDDMDSFYAKNYQEVEGYLDKLEVTLGPHNEIYNFMVEDKIEGAEPGFDLYFNGKDWIKPMLYGIEQSKESYVGVYLDELPPVLQGVADKFKKVLQKIDYRGAFSTELRITKDGKPYLIDVCARYPFPLSAGYTLSIKNYTEVIYKIAKGEEVKIENAGKFLVAMPLYSPHAESEYVLLNIPDKYKKYIKVRTTTMVKGSHYGVKGTKVLAVVCLVGDNYKKLIEAMDLMKDRASAFGISDEAMTSLKKIEETIKELPQYGLTGYDV